MRRIGLLVFLATLASCTTLGPMPAITAQSVVPAPRTGVEAQVAAVPGYYLSESVQENPKGEPMGQAAVMFEPAELIDLPGLVLGGRYVGKKESGGYAEPMLGYRRTIDAEQQLALGAFGFGTYAHGSNNEASYEATRIGAEAGLDLRVTPKWEWVEVHFIGSISATALDASGDYCLDQNGRFGVDCPDPPDPVVLNHASVSGIFPSAAGGIAFYLGRHLNGILHGSRIAFHGAVGRMPRVEYAEQRSGQTYTSAGFSLTLGLGASAPDKR